MKIVARSYDPIISKQVDVSFDIDSAGVEIAIGETTALVLLYDFESVLIAVAAALAKVIEYDKETRQRNATIKQT